MKLNYKNTCLQFLDSPENVDFYLPESNKGLTEIEERSFAESVKTAFAKDRSGLFTQKIRLLSKPFLEAYEKGKSKLKDVFDKEEMKETGTFITQLGSYTNTYFYYIQTSGSGDNWRVSFCLLIFTKHSQGELPGLGVCVFDNEKIRKTFVFKGWEDQGRNADWWLGWLVTLLCFIKYCPLETKIVNGGRREHHAGEKYVNETSRAVEIMDSTWFTTIIRSEGFNVGGHFRMQPYGSGMKQRRLQWIEPFTKEGYTKKARIL